MTSGPPSSTSSTISNYTTPSTHWPPLSYISTRSTKDNRSFGSATATFNSPIGSRSQSFAGELSIQSFPPRRTNSEPLENANKEAEGPSSYDGYTGSPDGKPDLEDVDITKYDGIQIILNMNHPRTLWSLPKKLAILRLLQFEQLSFIRECERSF